MPFCHPVVNTKQNGNLTNIHSCCDSLTTCSFFLFRCSYKSHSNFTFFVCTKNIPGIFHTRYMFNHKSLYTPFQSIFNHCQSIQILISFIFVFISISSANKRIVSFSLTPSLIFLRLPVTTGARVICMWY